MRSNAAILAVAAFAATSLASLNADVRTLVWTGATNGDWDRSTQNWYVFGDEDKTPVAFTNGDNVIFDDSATSKTVNLICDTANKFSIGTITFSNTVDYTWNSSKNPFYSGYMTTVGTVDKYGSGKLTINFRSDIQGNFTCHEGEVKSATGSWYAGEYRSTLGSLHDSRKVTFLPGSKFTASADASFGGPSSGNPVTALFNGAEVNLSWTHSFRNATFTNCTAFSISRGLSFYVTAKFLGHGATSPYVVRGTKEADYFGIGCVGSATWGDFTIDDVTGDGIAVDTIDDFIVSNKLGGVECGGNNSVARLGNHFRKRGKGTMVLAGNYSPFTNDIEVVEGRLAPVGAQVDLKMGVENWLNTGIGAVAGTRQRTITVDTDGIFEVRKNDVFGPLNTPQEWDLVVNGGKLEQKSGIRFSVGSLILNDATYEYGLCPSSSWFYWGLVSVSKKLAFKGTKNYVLANPGGTSFQTPYLTLGFTLSSATDDHPVDTGSHSHFTNMWTMVDFEVDKTASAQIDLPIRDMPNMCYPDYGTIPNGYTYDMWKGYWFRDGIRKTGEGTLTLTATNTYTHVTEVAEGTLVVNGSIEKSSGVTVKSGAYLGGIGTLPQVTVEDNGGFLVSASKVTTQATQVPSLAIAADNEGIVCFSMVDSAGNKGALDGHVLLKIGNKPVTLDVSKWKVIGDSGRKLMYALTYDPTTGNVTAAYNGGMIMLMY